MSNNDKMVYFVPGEKVQLKQKLEYQPVMVVKEINKSRSRGDEDKSILLGVTCFWFTVHGKYQEAKFNTKDIEKV